jgi:membrane-associated phospholipid phosphatase
MERRVTAAGRSQRDTVQASGHSGPGSIATRPSVGAREHRVRTRLTRDLRHVGRTVGWFGLIFVILIVYSWFRKTYFVPPPAEGYANALDLIDLQRRLGMAVTRVEIPMQEWVLRRDGLIDFFNFYYRNFKSALYLSVVLCLVLRPERFMPIFRVFLIATVIALPMYALYPLAPPRLMADYGYAFVDTLAVYDGVKSSSDGAGGANQFAAMPSMHIGWTTIAAMWLAAAIPRWRIGLIVGLLHVTLMCVTVVVTGNHYLLDNVAGFAVVGVAVAVARFFPRLLGRMQFARGRTAPRSQTADHPVQVPDVR